MNKNKLKRTLVFFLMVLLSCLSHAQYKKITGKITDDVGVEMPGVNIVVKGTTQGTVSDIDGMYVIELFKTTDSILVFSSIGMETQEIRVGNQNVINIKLIASAVDLGELIVVGYGVQEKESMVSAIDQVSGELIQGLRASNISSALSGVSPGLIAVTSSGQPGEDGAVLNIRGSSSINDDQALVVVDGVEQLSDFSYMDPEEIASISVLKDAAATAVYGVKGANGVIIITTNRGHEGSAKISYSSTMTIKQPTRPVEMSDAYNTLSLYNIASKNDGAFDQLISDEALQHYRDQDLPYLYPDVNWYEALIKKASISHKQNFAARGGTKFVKYFINLGYAYEGDAFKEEDLGLGYSSKNSFDKYSYRTNLDFNITKTTVLRTDFAGRMEIQNKSAESSFTSDIYDYPSWATPLYYPGDILEQYPDDNPVNPSSGEMRFAYNNLIQNSDNPYTRLHGHGVETYRRSVLTANFELIQDLDFLLEGLSVSGRFNMSSNNLFQQNINYSPTEFFLWEDGSWDNINGVDDQATNASIASESRVFDASSKNVRRDQLYYKVSFDYKRNFGVHAVSVLGLWSRNEGIERYGLSNTKEDWVGRLTYAYDKRYLLEASGAYNGTDMFDLGHKFGFFPAISGGWNIANESFIKNNLKFIDILKVRYSYGMSGSQSGAISAMYLSTYALDETKNNNQLKFGDQFLDQNGTIRQLIIGNPDATWETATKENLGIDFKVLKGHISGNVDFFRELRTDILSLPGDISQMIGTDASFRDENIADVKKHGYEITFKYMDETAFGWQFSLTAAYGFNENRRGNLREPAFMEEYLKSEGKPLKVNRVYVTDGLHQNIDEVLNYVTPSFGDKWMPGDIRYIDYNADGLIDDRDKIYHGYSKTPSEVFSLTFNNHYKNWNVKFFATAVRGVDLLAGGFYFPFYQERASQVRPEHFDYWTPYNLDGEWPTTHFTSVAYGNSNQNSMLTKLNSSYIRLKNVEVSYDIKAKGSKIPFDNCNVFISGYNLLTWSPMKYGEPEGDNIGNYPILRRFNVGAKINF